MTNQFDAPARATLQAEPAHVLRAISSLGSVMITTRAGGIVHERIGPIDVAEPQPGRFRFTGTCHNALFDISHCSRVVADTTARMGVRAFPRLDVLDAGGEALFAVVAMEGLAPFAEVLAPFMADAQPAAVRVSDTAPGVGGSTETDSDAGHRLLTALAKHDEDVAILVRKAGFTQRWVGRPGEPRLAGGFTNLIEPDFHLHVAMGSVTSWMRDENGLVAGSGEPGSTIFAIEGPAAALARALAEAEIGNREWS